MARMQRLVTVHPMRIELPLPSWNESTQRADDDAHTLTVEAAATTEWSPWQWSTEPVATLRTRVEAPAPVTVTVTL
jgi:hypothetical protein